MSDPLKRDKKGRLVKGTPPGPGRPIGSVSIITRIKQKFEQDPAMFEEWVTNLLKNPANQKAVMEQIDGKPIQPIAGVEGAPIVIQVTKYNDGDSQPTIQTT
jgi:hypothetical protein